MPRKKDVSPNKGGNAVDILKEAVEIGLGALVLTRERAEKISNDLVKKGKLKKREGASLLEEIVKKGRAEERAIEASIAKIVRATLSKINVANKADIRRLENEIKKMKAHRH